MRLKVTTQVWLYPGMAGAWHFVSLDKTSAEKVRKHQKGKPRVGWGAVPVEVTLGKTTWRTSIFPDSKSGTYILPLKALVRKKEGVYEGDMVTFVCVI